MKTKLEFLDKEKSIEMLGLETCCHVLGEDVLEVSFDDESQCQRSLIENVNINQKHSINGYVEFQIVLSGSVRCACDTEEVLAKTNDIIVLTSNVKRNLIEVMPNTKVCRLFLCIDLFGPTLTKSLKGNVIFNYIQKHLIADNPIIDYLKLEKIPQYLIDELFAMGDGDWGNKPRTMRDKLISWMAEIHTYVTSVSEREASSENVTFKTKVVSEIISYIEKNDVSKISLREVADVVFLHPNYICKIIKDVTGKTFTEIVNDIKLNMAFRLLEETDYSTSKISMDIGYRNPSYFYRVFKQYTGETPSNYRKRVRQAENAVLGSRIKVTAMSQLKELEATSYADCSNLILKNKSNLRIGFFSAGKYNYISEVAKGLAYTAEKSGSQVFMYIPDEDEINLQVSLLQQALSHNLDVIVINTHDEHAIEPILDIYKQQGIMICYINSDRTIFTNSVHAVVGYSQRKATRKLGDYAVGVMKNQSAFVGIIQGKTGYHSIERCGGFLDAVKPCDNFEIVSIYNGNWNAHGGYLAANKMLSAHNGSNINVIFCANDHEAMGVVRALEEKQISNVMLFSNDGDLFAIEAILEGKIKATVGTAPFNMGTTCFETILKVQRGEFEGGFVETEVEILDKHNVLNYIEKMKDYELMD